jgi:hypothetical protein
MEYLTLQDIPHRHYDPLHSRRMASSQTIEKPLGMADAVSQNHNSLPPLAAFAPGRQTPPFPLPRIALSAPLVLREQEAPTERPSHPYPHTIDHHQSFHEQHANFILQHNIVSPTYPDRKLPLPAAMEGKFTFRRDPHYYCSTAHACDCTKYNSTELELRQHAIKNTNFIQNHHMRNSPPIQPNEQQHPGKLPSFSEVYFSCGSWRTGSSNLNSFSTQLEQLHHHGLPLVGTAQVTALHMCLLISTRWHGRRTSGGA